MTIGELKNILEAHEHWLKEDIEGWSNMRADLRGAFLWGADLRGADLRGAILRDADLRGADLRDADLRDADLHDAILRDADLRGADLRDADLRGADLRGAKNINIPLACPSEGSFIAWKKCYAGRLVKLFIYKDSKRSSATTNKCRTDKAKVISIVDIDTGKMCKDAISTYDKTFIYRVGEIVSVEDFDENRFNECAPGIHFFIDKEAAIKY